MKWLMLDWVFTQTDPWFSGTDKNIFFWFISIEILYNGRRDIIHLCFRNSSKYKTATLGTEMTIRRFRTVVAFFRTLFQKGEVGGMYFAHSIVGCSNSLLAHGTVAVMLDLQWIPSDLKPDPTTETSSEVLLVGCHFVLRMNLEGG